MSYFDDFKKRLKSYGNDESGALKNSTQAFINRTFANSPNYKIVKVEGVDTPSRLINTNSFKEMDLILLPGTILQVGSLVEFDSLRFLISDFVKDKIVSKARLTVCVDKLKWYDKNSMLLEYNIIGTNASRFIDRSGFNNVGATLATDIVIIHVKRDSNTDKIVPSQRFILGGQAYSVLGIDNLTVSDSNGNGLIQMAITTTTQSPNDDMMNGIADNSLIQEKDSTNSVEGGTGGKLW